MGDQLLEYYDVVICGTGLVECILSGLLSKSNKTVLCLDRNAFYGGESASLGLDAFCRRFMPGTPVPPEFGHNKYWAIDLIPKFVMSRGKLVNILRATEVTRYLEWQAVCGTYVYQEIPGFFSTKYIHKVPANETEALSSSLMGMLEKNRCRKFLAFCAQYEREKPETQKNYDLQKTTMRKVFDDFGLQAGTIDFVGHAVALYSNDEYLDKPMGPTMDRIRLYMDSLAMYGGSPFLYPMHGLGSIAEGFSRLSAVHGGTFMLRAEVNGFTYGGDGKVNGVDLTYEGVKQHVKCGKVICDPTYVQGTPKIKLVGRVIRCINILNAPIKDVNDPKKSSEPAHSAQIIIPQKQVKRHNDVHIVVLSGTHCVCKEGKYLAIVSTTVETNNPIQEIQPALDVFGKSRSQYQFPFISDIYEPTDNGRRDEVYVSKSYDATSDYETACDDVERLWENIAGEPLDLTKFKRTPEYDDEE